ncbi:MAG: SGNH/GDSL hydrolase family protein [Opitutaceae bacterium]
MNLPRRRLLLLTFLAAGAGAGAAPAKWAASIDAFTRADATNPPPREAVLFVGSSSIVRWKSLARDFPDVPVINRGFGGSELADSVHYLDRLVLKHEPRVVVLFAGENALPAGAPAEEVHARFQAFRQGLHAALPRTRLVFIAIKPSPSRAKIRPQIDRANALIAATCREDPRLAFADVVPPMLDAAGQPRPELFVADRLHLSEAGYALWRPIVAPLLR